MNTILSVLLFVACATALPHGTYYKSWKPRYYYKPIHRPVYFYNPHHMKMPTHDMVDMEEAVDVRAEAAPLGDVVDVAVGAGSFKTLVQIVSDLGLVDTLKNAEALTIFAPSDEAFGKIDPEVLNSLTDEQKKAIVLRHVVTAKVPAAAVATGPVETIGGETIDLVKTAEGGVQVNYNGGVSNVVAADVMASNGVIHVIDSVILGAPAVEEEVAEPLGDVVDVAVGAGSFKTLVSIVSDLGLVDTLKNAEALTVFAPSDDAFAKIDPEVLASLTDEQKKTIVLRHVVTAKVPAAAVATGPVETIGGETIDLVKTAEGGVQVNYNGGVSNVVAADVMASNGVIHVIDSVILGAPAVEEEVAEPLGDVVDVAVGAGSFKTLVSIVSDLGLVDTLKNAEALTIFAPSDDAFAKIDPEVLASLTDEQKKTIVLRHVVTAKVPAAAVATGPVETIGGETIDLVKTAEGGVQVNYNGGTSNVVAADVMASNGVIHVIDKVIL